MVDESTAEEPGTPDPPDEEEIALHLKFLLNRFKKRGERLTIALVGESGVGKSSTINSLLGLKPGDPNHLPVGEFERMTMEVESFDFDHGGVPIRIVDTPGLCDDLPEKGNDKQYMDMLKDELKKAGKQIDCLYFVSRLDDTRVNRGAREAIKTIDKTLGRGIWKHVVFIFTQADRVEAEDYPRKLHGREDAFRKALIDVLGKYPQGAPPYVPVSNKNELLPDGTNWRNELWLTTLEQCKGKGTFLLSQAPADIDRDSFTPKQKEREEGIWSKIGKWLAEEAPSIAKAVVTVGIPLIIKALLPGGGGRK